DCTTAADIGATAAAGDFRTNRATFRTDCTTAAELGAAAAAGDFRTNRNIGAAAATSGCCPTAEPASGCAACEKEIKTSVDTRNSGCAVCAGDRTGGRGFLRLYEIKQTGSGAVSR